MRWASLPTSGARWRGRRSASRRRSASSAQWDHAYGMGWALINLAKVARAQGDYSGAAGLYRESLALRWAQGEKRHIAGCLRGLASVAAAARQYVRAARLYGAAEAAREAIGAPVPRHHARSDQAVARVRAGLGEPAFAAAWAAGRALPLAEAVAEALAVPAEAVAACGGQGADAGGTARADAARGGGLAAWCARDVRTGRSANACPSASGQPAPTSRTSSPSSMSPLAPPLRPSPWSTA